MSKTTINFYHIIDKIGIITDNTIEAINQKHLTYEEELLKIRNNKEIQNLNDDYDEDDENDKEVAYYHDCQVNDATFHTKIKCIEYEYQQFCTLFTNAESIIEKNYYFKKYLNFLKSMINM